MIDAPNWGQDWSFTMRDNAATVFAADPLKNTVFSIHMYGVFDTAAEINDYLNRFVTAKLPIVVGEFGFNHSDGNPDEDTIMATAQSLKIGYLGWSWSGNGGGVDTSTWRPASTRPSSPAGASASSTAPTASRPPLSEATVYGGVTPPVAVASSAVPVGVRVAVALASPSPSPSNSQPAGTCKVATASSGSGRAGSRAT